MSLRRKLAYLLPWVRRAEDRDIKDELESLRQFASPNELGNVTLAAEDARGVLSWLWLERIAQDVRYACRAMLHNKAFTALVVISLALGIGANTAIYSFMDGVLLRPLPVRDPEELVIMKWRARDYALASSGMMWSTDGSFTDATGTLSSIFPYAALNTFERADDVVATAFGYASINRLALTANGNTEPAKGQYVSGRFFEGIGVMPIAGRLIQQTDDAVGAPEVAVISSRFSQRFGTPAAAVGQTVRINDKPFLVIGVAPAEFFGAEPGAVPDVFVPMRADAVLEPGFAGRRYTDEHLYWMEIMARLKPGVPLERARAALAPRFRQFAAGTADTDAQRQDLPILELQSGATGLDNLRRKYAQPIYVLMGMVGLILLIACSNTANLLLSRAAARRREIAVRLGIGASRGRIIRQLLTESVLMASIGGALGIAVAWWGIRLLTQLISSGRDNFTLHAELNWTVLGVTLLLSIATGVLFGLAPALQATRVDIAPALKEVRSTSLLRRRRQFGLSHLLVVSQIVFSLVLLVGAGLFGRTLARLHAIELGFDRENVLVFTLRPGSVGYQGPAGFRLFEDLRTKFSRIPGVEAATLSAGALPMGGGTMTKVNIVGAQPPVAVGSLRPGMAAIASVGPNFFSTMRIPIAGRDLSEGDSATNSRVVVVNKRLATAFGIENPIGRTLVMGKDQFEIVGLADDALIFTLKEERRPVLYLSYLQAPRPPYGMVFEIRANHDPLALAGAVRQVVRQVDSRLAVHDLKTQAMHVDQAISSEITLARLCAAFAALALVIACVGLYGTVAFNVSRRTNEIGIRMTLGAARSRITWMVLRDVLLMTAAGLAIGVPIALVGARSIRSLLYGIEPTDLMSLAIGVGALVACGLLAGVIPALRASRIDPLAAVRHE